LDKVVRLQPNATWKLSLNHGAQAGGRKAQQTVMKPINLQVQNTLR
jgi:hypothetical protein